MQKYHYLSTFLPKKVLGYMKPITSYFQHLNLLKGG